MLLSKDLTPKLSFWISLSGRKASSKALVICRECTAIYSVDSGPDAIYTIVRFLNINIEGCIKI